MRKHLGRNLLLIATLIVVIITLYPTLGWYRLDEAEQNRRIEQWRQEEINLRKEGAGIFARASHGIKKWSQFNRDMVINLGLDLQGGVLMVIGFNETEETKARGMDLAGVQDLVLLNIENRVNEFEAKEPIIQKLGTNQIQIQLPGQKDIQRAKDLITQTAKLGFHIVSAQDETIQVFTKVDEHFKNGFVPFLEAPAFRGNPFELEEANYELLKQVVDEANNTPGLLPENRVIAFSGAPKDWQGTTRRQIYLMEKQERMGGEGLSKASPGTDPQNPGNWLIIFSFGGDDSTKFANLTEEFRGRQMAIVVDQNVVSAPTIQERILGEGRITGNFTAEEAKDLAIALNSGLPVPVREEYAAIVGASIGAEAVRSGLYASFVGLALVFIAVIAWYRFAGVIAAISLVVNGVLILAAFAYFDITLTLPGIAGLVLTIGMAVDSNVLIYERIREEQLHGKSFANCIEAGFQNAASAIIDSNVTHFIAAMVLLQFGTGAIQGFAIALAVGVASTLFAALVVSRAMIDFLLENSIVSKFSMNNLIPLETRINFLGNRRACGIASLIAIAASIGVFALRGEDNFGVDFRTGTNARIAINNEAVVSDGDVRDHLVQAGFPAPVVQRFEQESGSKPNTFIIRVGQTESLEGAEGTVSSRLQKALLPLSVDPASTEIDKQVELLAVESVGPAVGGQLRFDAVQTVAYALLFIMLFLWFRFEWKFAFAALVGMAHDVLIVVGLMSALGQQISTAVIAALLTIIGYSLNDKIVVFDRVRSDLVLNKSRGLSFLDGLNASINRTFSRTMLTAPTTLFVVVVLYIFGGDELKPFSLAMVLGIVVGTYSSIYIASPVVLAWQNWRDKRGSRPHDRKTTRNRKGPSPAA